METSQAANILRVLGLLPGLGPGRLKPRLPRTAVQISSGRVAAIRLAPGKTRKGGDTRPVLAAHQEAPLPEGAVDPSLTETNVPDPKPVAGAVERVLSAVAPRDSRVSVIIPDGAARVSILGFTRMPASRREALELVRFRMQKVLPFRIEEAVVDCHLLSDFSSPEPEFLVALIQRPILWQYERLFTGQERVPGLVDLESFNVANLARASWNGEGSDSGDRALVNAAEGCLTVLFFRGGKLNFYRSKSFAPGERREPSRFHAAMRRELASSAAFYREHLSGAGLIRADFRVAEGDAETVLAVAGQELGCACRLLDVSRAVALPQGSDPADPRWQILLPALGAALGRKS